MSLKDKIAALGDDVSADVKEILHEIAVLVGVAAPVAEVVETAVAPEDLAITEGVAAAAKAVETVTEDAPVVTTVTH